MIAEQMPLWMKLVDNPHVWIGVWIVLLSVQVIVLMFATKSEVKKLRRRIRRLEDAAKAQQPLKV